MRACALITAQLLLSLPWPSPALAGEATPAAAAAASSDSEDGAFYIFRRPLKQPQTQPRSLDDAPLAARGNETPDTGAVAAFAAGTGDPSFDEAAAAIRAVEVLAAGGDGGADGARPANDSLPQRWVGGGGGGNWNCVARGGYEYCGGSGGYWGAASSGPPRPAVWIILAGAAGTAAAGAAAWS